MTDVAASTADLRTSMFPPEFYADPYAMYGALRDHTPVQWSSSGQSMWLLFRYDDVSLLLKDRCASRDFSRLSRDTGPEVTAFMEGLRNVLLFMDPPDHTSLRQSLSGQLGGTVLARARSSAQDEVDIALSDIGMSDEFDVVQDLAYPMALAVIAHLLGIPSSDWRLFAGWSRSIIPIVDAIDEPMIVARAREAIAAFTRYLDDLVDGAGVVSGSLLDCLSRVPSPIDKPVRDLLVGTAIMLTVAGHETTVNAVGNGLSALLSHPSQFALLQERPELMRSAIEEILRYDAPTQFTGRVASAAFRIRGAQIKRGDLLVACLGAANRDQTVFPDADQFRVDRTPNRHLAFGAGIHYCLGADLARLELEVVLRTLLNRFPRLRLAGSGVRKKTTALRGFESLKVRG